MDIWNKAEIDFIVQYQNDIIPIEVKAGENVMGKSMIIYEKQFQPKVRIRYSLKNLKNDGNLINIPLFMVDNTKKILESYFQKK